MFVRAVCHAWCGWVHVALPLPLPDRLKQLMVAAQQGPASAEVAVASTSEELHLALAHDDAAAQEVWRPGRLRVLTCVR